MSHHFDRQYFELLFEMTKREFTVRYKRAFFGLLWIFLNPLFQMAVIGVVFSYFVKIDNYFLFLFSGLLPWQFVSTTILKVTPTFVYEKALIEKSSFAREIIPLSMILSNFLNFLISECLLLFYILFAGHFTYLTLPLVLVASLWLLIIVCGVSFITASLNVRFRDVNFFTQAVVTLWFYASPILYSINLVPQRLVKLLQINPLTVPLELFHTAFLDHPIPNLNMLLSNLAILIVSVFVGILIFRKESPYFTDNL